MKIRTYTNIFGDAMVDLSVMGEAFMHYCDFNVKLNNKIKFVV